MTGVKPRLLLHACCGPCLAGTLANIAEFFDITVYFYNPNIMPKEEFILRLDALKQIVSHFDGIKLVIPEQDESEYLPLVKGLENAPEGGTRCIKCYELRLRNTAEYFAAHKDEFDFFTTTLTISPLKNASSINGIGNVIAHELGVTYLSSDFKKRDGYLKSTTLCKQWGIYRQHYCGCALRAHFV
ncbi:MAG: epoxyqueuosine reductase QueH [Clostridia bacterium]|nr:epoxyqueuosine reductase QueH [Clostridia bacterium]